MMVIIVQATVILFLSSFTAKNEGNHKAFATFSIDY